MEAIATFHALTTADTEPDIFRMELVLDVKLDIKEQFVQQVFFFGGGVIGKYILFYLL